MNFATFSNNLLCLCIMSFFCMLVTWHKNIVTWSLKVRSLESEKSHRVIHSYVTSSTNLWQPHHDQSLSHMHTTVSELLKVVFSHQITMKQYTDSHVPIEESPLYSPKPSNVSVMREPTSKNDRLWVHTCTMCNYLKLDEPVFNKSNYKSASCI
jgi:hypothetical protein